MGARSLSQEGGQKVDAMPTCFDDDEGSSDTGLDRVRELTVNSLDALARLRQHSLAHFDHGRGEERTPHRCRASRRAAQTTTLHHRVQVHIFWLLRAPLFTRSASGFGSSLARMQLMWTCAAQ